LFNQSNEGYLYILNLKDVFPFVLLYRVNVIFTEKDGKSYTIRGKVGDNILYLGKRFDVPVEGITLLLSLHVSIVA